MARLKTVQTSEVLQMSEAGVPGSFSPVAWIPPRIMKYETWEGIGHTLQTIRRSTNFWIGDWLQAGEQRYGETYAQAINTTGNEYQQLANCKWVSSRVPPEVRTEELSWSHHREVARLKDVDDQVHCLQYAIDKRLSSSELKEYVRTLHAPIPIDSPAPSPDIETFEFTPDLASADLDGDADLGDAFSDPDWYANPEAYGSYMPEVMSESFQNWWEVTQEDGRGYDWRTAQSAFHAGWNIGADEFSTQVENPDVVEHSPTVLDFVRQGDVISIVASETGDVLASIQVDGGRARIIQEETGEVVANLTLPTPQDAHALTVDVLSVARITKALGTTEEE